MKLTFALLLFLFSTSGFSDVWKTDHSWNATEENSYSEWVAQNWKTDIFKIGLLKDLKTDCADASYAMRATYSYLNQLPFAASQGDGKLMTNRSNEFDSIYNDDQRFIAFLKQVFLRTNTNTLSRDTFPIVIDRAHFKPGILYVNAGEHSFQLISVTDGGVPLLFASTSPEENRFLVETQGFPFYFPESGSHADGYRAFRWPEEMKIPVESLKRASLEQFKFADSHLIFTAYVQKKLALRPETIDEHFERQMKNVCHFAKERTNAVINGYMAHIKAPGQCLRGSDYDAHSTPARDYVLKSNLLELKKIRDNSNWDLLKKEYKRQLISVFNPDVQAITCTIETGTPELSALTLGQIWNSFEAGKIQSNPNFSVAARWGLAPAVNPCSQK